MNDINRPITITICGDGGCGKSAITLRLVRSQWSDDYDPTIEDSYAVSRLVDGHEYMLRLTDTAGQEEYRSLWAASNLQSDAFLLVFDITKHDSLHGLEHYAELIQMEADRRADDLVPIESLNSTRTPSSGNRFFSSRRYSTLKPRRMVPRQTEPVMLVAGNKCDLHQFREISQTEARDWATSHGCAFLETSARDMINIEEAFAILVKGVVERRRQSLLDPLQTISSPHSPSATSTGASVSSSLVTTLVGSVDRWPDSDGPWARWNVCGEHKKPSIFSKLWPGGRIFRHKNRLKTDLKPKLPTPISSTDSTVNLSHPTPAPWSCWASST